MIIGNGLLGREFQRFSQSEKVILIAAGISNSLEESESELNREIDLIKSVLENNNRKKKVFYISTCSIYQKAITPYIKNKLEIENLIQNDSTQNKIFRLPNVIGKTNNSTMISFFFSKIAKQEAFNLHKFATRQFIDVTDAAKIISEFTFHDYIEDSIINVTNGNNLNVTEIVDLIAELLGTKAIYNIVYSGESYYIPNEILLNKFRDSVIFNDNYFYKVLLKYRSFFGEFKQ